MAIFLDCDGVLANFNQHVSDLCGDHPRNMPDDMLWDKISVIDDFWLTVPVMPDAHELVEYLSSMNRDLIVLTGCPKTNFQQVSEHKKQWIQNHFENIDVITCLSKNKPMYMRDNNDILIDDFSRNCNKWIKAGGIAIRYRNFEQTKIDLQIII